MYHEANNRILSLTNKSTKLLKFQENQWFWKQKINNFSEGEYPTQTVPSGAMDTPTFHSIDVSTPDPLCWEFLAARLSNE